jgi:hypothetical protein
MKVYIRHNKLRFVIPVPLWILTLVGKSTIKHMIIKHTPKEHRKYVESIDFNELNKAIEVLKQYKGMEMVNVNSSDGTIVKITL